MPIKRIKDGESQTKAKTTFLP